APGVAARLPLTTVWARPWPDAPDRSLWYWIVAGLVPVPALVTLLRRRPRTQVVETADASLRLLVKEHATDAGRVLAALRRALSARLGGTTIPWADPHALRRALRHHGITDQTIDSAMSLLAHIENSAYGSHHQALPDAAAQ